MMRGIVGLLLATLVLAALATVALAQDYVPWETYGQVSPDRVLAERLADGYYLGADFAPYTESYPLAFGTLTEQYSPDRAFRERVAAGYPVGPRFLAYTVPGRYAYGTVTEQVSPDRVLTERLASQTY